ncbi:30S ribosomal protein S8e [Candidatus Pacearchaeota archaeon]|nr:MAG: 30S ribosomal protein S8e [Candidatus Pacearchaeota archaeon]
MKKISGGKYRKAKKKKLYEKTNVARKTMLGPKKIRTLRTKGGKEKQILLAIDKAYVFDKETKKGKVVKINSVIKTPSNRYLKNVLMKGSIIDSELGKAKVTNRPGQEGNVFAVLIKE